MYMWFLWPAKLRHVVVIGGRSTLWLEVLPSSSPDELLEPPRECPRAVVTGKRGPVVLAQ